MNSISKALRWIFHRNTEVSLTPKEKAISEYLRRKSQNPGEYMEIYEQEIADWSWEQTLKVMALNMLGGTASMHRLRRKMLEIYDCMENDSKQK